MIERPKFDLSVYVIIDPATCNNRQVEEVARQARAGGATMIQLRNKSDDLSVVEQQAGAVQHALDGSDIPFILNDHVELAAKINADGVHIGQEDMSANEARAIIGADKILGLTAFTDEHYAVIDSDVVDYVGTGPFYPTLTKPDKAVLGAEKFKELIPKSPVPVVGIGGITPQNAHAVITAGADGVAMMRAVTAAEDITQATRDFVRAVERARHGNS
ncbi:MAG: thiamine phosphate synthase [Alcanivorax sp.]